jgi:hypothetical protein
MGTLILHLGEIVHSPLWVAFTIQALFFVIASGTALVLYFSGRRGPGWLVLLLSPVFLTYAFHDLSGGFRKELIGFSAFGLLAASYVRRWAAIPMTVAAALVFALAVFSHEANALALPFFLFVLWRGAETGLITRRQMFAAGGVFAALAAAAVVFAIFFRGDSATTLAICDAIVVIGLRRDLFCEAGALLHLANSPSEDFKYVTDLVDYIRVYAVALLLGLAPLALIRQWSPVALLTLALGAGAIAPLFLVAIDWGRWINIFAFYAFSLALADSVWRPMTIVAAPWPFALYSIAGWSIAHCCTSAIGTGLWGWFLAWMVPKAAALFALVT